MYELLKRDIECDEKSGICYIDKTPVWFLNLKDGYLDIDYFFKREKSIYLKPRKNGYLIRVILL